ncbi:UNVERIFIED_CONTAM: hypothetical protein Sradi_3643100 [Sesamum radiatum]|uniref:Zinc knuckle CX2CX4HX4C domain-containing protein n=1 Tax=Sesamum radiatum TaxID=300843 RepID=A0AAW2QIE5_SESRA
MQGMEVRMLSNRFLLRFNHYLDWDKVLGGCPWTIDRNLVILNVVSAEENPLSLDLNWYQFYVHIHDLPIRMMTQVVVKYIGNHLGKFINYNNMVSWGASVRIRVLLDMRMLLKRFLIVQAPAEELTMSFTYERLSNFCYKCGILGDILRDCLMSVNVVQLGGGEELQYGAGLRESRAVRVSLMVVNRGRGGVAEDSGTLNVEGRISTSSSVSSRVEQANGVTPNRELPSNKTQDPKTSNARPKDRPSLDLIVEGRRISIGRVSSLSQWLQGEALMEEEEEEEKRDQIIIGHGVTITKGGVSGDESAHKKAMLDPVLAVEGMLNTTKVDVEVLSSDRGLRWRFTGFYGAAEY